jgi:hypothetical protein
VALRGTLAIRLIWIELPLRPYLLRGQLFVDEVPEDDEGSFFYEKKPTQALLET